MKCGLESQTALPPPNLFCSLDHVSPIMPWRLGTLLQMEKQS